jgi:hypothetical protein
LRLWLWLGLNVRLRLWLRLWLNVRVRQRLGDLPLVSGWRVAVRTGSGRILYPARHSARHFAGRTGPRGFRVKPSESRVPQ